jgi:glycosyltransferase 2 family protein
MVLPNYCQRSQNEVSLLSKHRKAINCFLLLATFLAIGLFVANNFEQLRTTPIHFRWNFILYGLVFTLLGHLCGFVTWAWIAASFNMRTPWPHAGKAWFVSRLGRYVPGKIALILMRFNAYTDHSKTKVSAATLIEAYTSVCAASILLLLLTLTTTNAVAPSAVSAGALVFVLMICARPQSISLGLYAFERIFHTPRLYALPRQRETLAFVLVHLVTMFLHGAALFMALNAIGHVDLGRYLLVTVAFFAAGLIGMLAVFAPSGIGVREAALLVILAPYIDATTLILGAVLIRLLGILSEIVLSIFFVACERVSK